MLVKSSILIDPQAFTGNQQDRWVQGRDGGVSFGVCWISQMTLPDLPHQYLVLTAKKCSLANVGTS